MPTIAEAVRSNIIYKERNPMIGTLPIDTGPSWSQAPVTFPPTPSLPVRSSLPPEAFASDHVTPGSNPGRIFLRSGVWSSPDTIPKHSTPQTLTNKKLLGPVIGVGGSPLNRYNRLVGMITPSAIGANSSASQLFTVSGVQAADSVLGYQWLTMQKAAVPVLAVRVAGDNSIAIDFSNPTAGSLTPTGGKIVLFLAQ